MRLFIVAGGPSSLIKSSYFWLAVLLTALGWRRIEDESWTATALSILPNLAGFSIAAFAILFAILDPVARRALRAPADVLNGRSPLLVLGSSVTHAVVVQVVALLFAFTFSSKPFTSVNGFECVALIVNFALSAGGLLLFLYGVLLVLASVLTIFKMLEIAS